MKKGELTWMSTAVAVILLLVLALALLMEANQRFLASGNSLGHHCCEVLFVLWFVAIVVAVYKSI